MPCYLLASIFDSNLFPLFPLGHPHHWPSHSPAYQKEWTLPYDTIVWAEAAAMSGLTNMAALAGQNHSATGDTLTLKSTPSPPWLLGMGVVSDTKPAASGLVPTTSNGGKTIYGPGGLNYSVDGWASYLRDIPIELVKSDIITGQGSNTNVSEGTVLGADIAYGSPPAPWHLAALRSKYSQIYSQKLTITSGSAVVFNSGVVSLDSAAADITNWLDVNAAYEILGICAGTGAATFGGILNITGLGGEWSSKQPGLVINPLSAVTFAPGGAFIKVLEPIPFQGDALPSVGMTASSAGAIIFNLVFGKIGGSPN